MLPLRMPAASDSADESMQHQVLMIITVTCSVSCSKAVAKGLQHEKIDLLQYLLWNPVQLSLGILAEISCKGGNFSDIE